MSIISLPPELIQHIISYIYEPDSLLSLTKVHMEMINKDPENSHKWCNNIMLINERLQQLYEDNLANLTKTINKVELILSSTNY